jgi:hypothetical protein
VIALFHSRLGAPTKRAPSGTAEEIEHARGREVPVHVYFSQMPLPYSIDTAELERLRQYQQELQSQGLLGSFVSIEDLAAQVRTALERDVSRAVEHQSSRLAQPVDSGLRRALEAVAGRGALMRGRVVMGRPGDERLVVENVGQAPAENVTIELDPIGGGRAPEVLLESPIEVVPPGGSIKIIIVVTMGVASQWRLTIRWTEGGVAFHEVQSLTPF